MKKIFKFSLIALMVAPFALTGCKKGENDPFLSVKSRKARLVGEWTVSKGEGKSTSGSTTTTWTYDGTTETQTTGSNTSTRTVTYSYTFEKDGSMTYVETETGTILGAAYTDVSTQTGMWNFRGRVGDAKNKDAVIVTVNSFTNTYTISGNTNTSTNSCTGDDCFSVVLEIDRLSNKEVILKSTGTSTDASGTDTSEDSWTLVQ